MGPTEGRFSFMDIVVLARMCLRRWYVVLVVFGLIAAYAFVQYSSAKPSYSASAQLIVVGTARVEVPRVAESTTPTAGATPSSSGSSSPSVPNSNGSTGDGATPTAASTDLANPLQTVQTTLLALVSRMQAEPSVVQVVGGSATYSVAQVTKGGPLLLLSASGTSRAATLAALNQGIPAVSESLTGLQNDVGAPASTRFRAVTLQVDQTPTVAYPSRAKGLIVTLVVGLLAAILVAVVVDAIAGRRRGRRGSGTPLATEDHTPAAGHRVGSRDTAPVSTVPGSRARRRARSSP